MKKIKSAAFITAIILIFNMATAVAFTDTLDTDYEQAALVLNSLSIINGYSDKTFRPGETLTRAEFAAIAVRTMGEKSFINKQGDVKFSDVGQKHWAYGEINLASERGYFTGYGDGTFGPEDTVTFEQAVKVVVSMLGYGGISEAAGGYPSGYLATALQKRILQGISSSGGKPILRGETALLIYNALDKEMLLPKSIGTISSRYESDGATILSEKLGIEKTAGIVTANSLTELKGGIPAPKGHITVNGKDYDANKTDAESYIGYNVVLYAENDEDTKKILLIYPDQNNTVSRVSAEDIDLSTNTSRFAYWENDRLYTLPVSSETTMIYNSKSNYLFEKDDMIPASGEVLLLDNNRDGVIDVLLVNEYVHYIIKKIDSVNSVVYDEYGKEPIDLNPDVGTITYKILRSGREIPVRNLVEGQVLSVIRSIDRLYIEINVVASPVRGSIAAIEGEGEYQIGENVYKTSTGMPADMGYKVGDNGIFYLDIEGRIIKAELSDESLGLYAYLINAGIEEGLSGELNFKLFTNRGKMEIISASKRIRLNGNYADYNEVLAHFRRGGDNTKEGVVMIRTDSEGKISEISDPELSFEQAERVYRRSTKMFGFRASTTSFLISDEETVVFSIPEAGSLDRNYKVLKSTEIGNLETYNCLAYGLEGVTVGCVVIDAGGDAETVDINTTASLALVRYVAEAIDEDGMIGNRIYYMNAGKEDSVMCADGASAYLASMTDGADREIEITDLKTGDIIYLAKDAGGLMTRAAKVFPQADTGNMQDEPRWIKSRGWSAERAFGKAYMVDGSALLLEVENERYLYDLSRLSGAMYRYDSDTEKISIATVADILDIVTVGDDAPYIYIRANAGLVIDVVIYY